MRNIALYLACAFALAACRKEVDLSNQPFVKYYGLDAQLKHTEPLKIVPAVSSGQFVLLGKTTAIQPTPNTQSSATTPGMFLIQFDKTGIINKRLSWDNLSPTQIVMLPNKTEHVLLRNSCLSFPEALSLNCNCSALKLNANLEYDSVTISAGDGFLYYGKDILPLENGGYLFVGSTNRIVDKSATPDYIEALDKTDAYIAELAADFSVVWDTVYGFMGNDMVEQVKKIGNGFGMSLSVKAGLELALPQQRTEGMLLYLDESTRELSIKRDASQEIIKDMCINGDKMAVVITSQNLDYTKVGLYNLNDFSSSSFNPTPQLALENNFSGDNFYYNVNIHGLLGRDDETLFMLGKISDYPMIDILSWDSLATNLNPVVPGDFGNELDPLTCKLYVLNQNFSPSSNEQSTLPDGNFICGLITEDGELIAAAEILSKTSKRFNRVMIIKTDLSLEMKSEGE